MKDIYAEDFFNIPNPVSPWVTIQFRTSFTIGDNGKIDKEIWEEITMDPSNFFDNMVLEDAGGIYHVTLKLFDKNFANLENLIMKSITASRLANELSKNPDYVDKTGYFNFVITESSNANLRIRFGYSIWDDERYIDETDFTSEDFTNRIKKIKPVIRSPWIYLQILGLKSDFTSNGYGVELNCYSTTNTFLDRAKMVQKFAKLVGKPEDVIRQVGNLIEDASNNTIRVEIDDNNKPKALKNENKTEEIEVMLGGEPIKTEINGKTQIIPQFKSLKSLFNDICSKIEPIKYNASGSIINVNSSNIDGSDIDEENNETSAMAKYGYSVIQKTENGKKISIIKFKYLDPVSGLNNQSNMRVYNWLYSEDSIIKSFNIQSSIDFAQLNAPITILGKDGQAHNFLGIPDKPSEDSKASQMNNKITKIKNITEGLKSGDFKAYFTSDILSSNNQGSSITNQNQDASMYATILMNNINNGVFKGNIEIPGDPFYLFDGKISPYVYNIKIIVRRPDYYDENGNLIDGGISYLSGIYTVGKITHTINFSGFTTNLELMRFPLPSKEKV